MDVFTNTVSNLVGAVVQKLLSSRKLQSIEHFSEKLRNMIASINEAYALLLNEEMIFQVDNVQVDMLTRICYDAEDIAREIEYKTMNSLQAPEQSSPMSDARIVPGKRFLPALARLEVMIDKLQKYMESIIKVQKPYSKSSQNTCPSHFHKECTQELSIVGMEDDYRAIIQKLASQEKSESLGLWGVSIVGMNGVGKSALAHLILNDDSVAQLFPRRMWVSLSGNFHVEEIAKQLVDSYRTMDPNYKAPVSYYDSLRGLLAEDVPWLIVLDNLLDVSFTEWKNFQSSFLSSSSRGKIIITTVNCNISIVTRTTGYYLHSLSVDNCRHIILLKTGMDHSPSFQDKIYTLAQNCCGLPIIANFIGSQLRDKDKRETVLDRDLWKLPEFQRRILPTLTATYSMLETYHLRKCFVYLSLFPHDYLYSKEDLIHLWIAEGFIQHQEESSLEHVGLVYFQTLVKWSILQSSDVYGHDGPTYYTIHESTHKLAQLMASDTCFCLDEQVSYSGSNTRHLSLRHQYLTPEILNEIKNLKGIRTFLPLGPISIQLSVAYFFKRLLYIRVLSFKHSDVVQIPNSIDRLKLLRYLDVSYTQIRKLPEAIAKLYSLQFLKLRNTENLLQLPKKFKKLINLRYVDWELSDMSRLISTPSSIGKLTSLQRLPLFVVRDRKGYKIEELCNMVHLQGSLRIASLENIKNSKEAAAAQLSNKTLLGSLEFEWTSNLSSRNNIAEDVLTALEPHKSLSNLRITNYGGHTFPQWLTYLNQLETLYLGGCRFCTILPALGNLASLKYLHIENMSRLMSIEELFCRSSYDKPFPKLESLMLKQLPKLHQLIRLTSTDLPRLQDLSIVDCPELIGLLSFKHLNSLVKLQIINCAGVQDCTLRDPNIQVVEEPTSSKGSKFQEDKVEAQKHILRKPSGRWDTPSLLVLKAIVRMRVTIMKKYTTKLVNKLVPKNEEKTCMKQLAQFRHHLQMMLHCLLFPKDYEFEKERLVRLWIAAGFMENEPMEYYGNRFFDFLLKLSFIINSRNDTFDGTKMYKFNSMKCSSYFEQLGPINHFNEKLDNANVVVNRFDNNWDISVMSSGIDTETFGLLEEFSDLRTILFLNGSLLTKVPSNLFLALKFLRALDFSCSGIKVLPDSVQNAKQLRYLDLSWTVIERLPDSITHLGELQDLKLKGCEHLFHLPKAVNKLTKLRHLDFDILGQLTSMPEGIGELVELRTLWAFIVSLGSEDDCNIGELNNMNHLSGKLCISGLENVMKLEDAQSAGLANKPYLSHLELRWSNIYEENERCNYVEVLEGLKPETRLQHLQLICFPGSKFPKWISDHSYKNLVSIMLYRCDNCECLPSLGELPILQKLEILEMNGVRKIDEGFFGDVMHQKPFPKLEMLTIDGMHSLEKWDGLNGNNFGAVVNLIIKHCPKLSELVPSHPCLHSLQHLELVSCPALGSLPDGLLSTSLQTLIIEYCPFGYRYQEAGVGRNKINDKAEVWIFPDVQSSDEDATEEDAFILDDSCTEESDTGHYVPNGI